VFNEGYFTWVIFFYRNVEEGGCDPWGLGTEGESSFGVKKKGKGGDRGDWERGR